MNHRIYAALLAASAAFGLSGCITDDYDDYGYGYGGVSLGYSNGYYGGSPYWGWYDDYYYPGTGYYIYDRGGRRHAWNDNQRRYWESRRGSGTSWRGRDNWSGYRSGLNSDQWQQRREAWRAQRQQQGMTDQSWQQRREAWRAQRQQQGMTDQSWQQRREAWQAQRAQQGDTSGWRGRGNWSGGQRGWRNRGN